MKKILLLLVILFCTQTINAQEPTKQETMDWIASKFKTNLSKKAFIHFGNRNLVFFEYSFISYDQSGIITYKCNRLLEDHSRDNFETTLNLNLILTILIYPNGDITLKCSNNFSLLFERIGANDNKTDYRLIDWTENGEIDLKNRMIKAFLLLAKYNNENKPKEKF